MAERDYSIDLTIRGERGSGRTSLAWLITQVVETYGGHVSVPDEDPRLAKEMHEMPPPVKPYQGNMRKMHVTIKYQDKEETGE